MKKHVSLLFAAALMTGALLTGCSGSKPAEATPAQTSGNAPEATQETEQETIAPFTEADPSAETKKETAQAHPGAPGSAAAADQNIQVRIGSLKGPTSMGLVQLMDLAAKKEAVCNYDFTMVTAADELLGKMVNGDLDIALVPANVASVLYNKTEGGVAVIDINTLGVLDIVASDESITSIADLKGKTLYLTGKGTTPDYVIQYLMKESGLQDGDVTLEYKSEAAEVAAVLKEQPDAIGLLPQPFVTAACAQNPNLKIVLDLTKEWDKLQGEGGSRMVTGVTVVRREFLDKNKELVDAFLTEHAASAAYTASNPNETAELIAAAGIIEKAPVAKKALPYCNIVCLTGSEMQTALSGYLQVLADQDMKSVGGKLPADDFYYLP